MCIVTDPRSTSSYGQAYTVECLGNVVGGRPVLYNNQPVEILMDLVTTSLKNGEPVWFGCEVSKRFAAKQGIEDLTIHDFKLVFGVDIQLTLTKGDRMIYGESAMTHAMTFTAVSCDVSGFWREWLSNCKWKRLTVSVFLQFKGQWSAHKIPSGELMGRRPWRKGLFGNDGWLVQRVCIRSGCRQEHCAAGGARSVPAESGGAACMGSNGHSSDKLECELNFGERSMSYPSAWALLTEY